MKKLLFISFGILLLLPSCRKELPEAVVEEPVFTLSAIVSGGPLEIAAGEDNYYLYTSFQADSTGANWYEGAFRKVDCPDCPGNFMVRLKDGQSPSSAKPDMDASLLQDYSPGGDDRYRVQFLATPDGPGPLTFHWDFGDGNTSGSANPTHTFSSGTFDICLTVEYGSGCVDTLCNTMTFLGTDNCLATFSHQSAPGSNAVSFSPLVRGEPPFTYFWEFGDGANSSQESPTHFYNSQTTYEACLTVTDANKSVSYFCGTVDPFNIAPCMTNYRAILDSQETGAGKQVVVEYIAEDKIAYLSDGGLQPAGSYFSITDHESYERNESNQATEKISAGFELRLFNENDPTQYIDVKSGEVVFGVAYPD